VLDLTDTTVLIGAGVIVALLAMTGISVAIMMSRQQHSADEKQLKAIQAKRRAEYLKAEATYKKCREKIEKANHGNTVLIDLIHDLGDDFVGRDGAEQQIAFDEAFEAVAAIREAHPRAKIVVVLHTLGGYARPAHMMAMALKNFLKKSKRKKGDRTVVYVPYVAMSGGTMIALASDKVVVGKAASLGPIDTIYGGFPNDAYQALLEQKGPLATQDVLVLLAHEADKYDRYARDVAREIVNDKHKRDDKPAHYLADHLSAGKMSHSQAITAQDARNLGMNVSDEVPRIVYDFVDARIRMIKTRLEHEEKRLAEGDKSSDGAETAEQRVEKLIHQTLRGGVKI
jgi:ClpP class serine protease